MPLRPDLVEVVITYLYTNKLLPSYNRILHIETYGIYDGNASNWYRVTVVYSPHPSPHFIAYVCDILTNITYDVNLML